MNRHSAGGARDRKLSRGNFRLDVALETLLAEDVSAVLKNNGFTLEGHEANLTRVFLLLFSLALLNDFSHLFFLFFSQLLSNHPVIELALSIKLLLLSLHLLDHLPGKLRVGR